MKKIYLIIFTYILVGCWREQSPNTFTKIVKATKVEPLNFYEKQFVGTVGSAQNVNLAFSVGGLVDRLYVGEGNKVEKGEILASLDPSDYELELSSALAQYEASKAIEQRSQRLHQRGAISTQELDIAKADYYSAQSNYQYRLNRLADTRLYAPFGGSIEKQYVDTFEEVSAGTLIFRLSSPDILEVKFTLPEGDASALLTGVDYFIEFENIPNKRFEAEQKSVIDGSSSRAGLPVTLGFDSEGLTNLIKPGFSSKVIMRFVDNNDFANYTTIPLSALYSADGVWVYNPKTQKVETRKVTTAGLKGKDRVIISSGLKSGEIVVSAGLNSLEENMTVKTLD